MTEDEWRISSNPQKMRAHLEERPVVSERKLRLFAAACCRRVERWFIDPCQHAAVDVLEQYADGLVRAVELDTAGQAADTIDEGHVALSAEWTDVAQDALDAAYHAAQAVAQATCNDRAGEGNPTYFHRLYDTLMHVVDAAGYAAVALDLVNGRSLPAQAAEQRALADLLRDIFGNPFRPVAVEAAWLTSTVVGLARGIYDERAFDRLPILADALQDAGCDSAEVLDHCRSEGPHVRGCWAVDLVLGKS